MPETQFAELESLFLALGDKTRLRLLTLMADGPVAVGFLADQLGESQPKVSRHLAYLRRAGVVSTRREGKWIYYGIQEPEDSRSSEMLDVIITELAGKTTARQGADAGRMRPARPMLETEISAEPYEIVDDDSQTSYEDHYEGTYEPDEMEIYLL